MHGASVVIYDLCLFTSAPAQLAVISVAWSRRRLLAVGPHLYRIRTDLQLVGHCLSTPTQPHEERYKFDCLYYRPTYLASWCSDIASGLISGKRVRVYCCITTGGSSALASSSVRSISQWQVQISILITIPSFTSIILFSSISVPARLLLSAWRTLSKLLQQVKSPADDVGCNLKCVVLFVV